MKPKHIKRLQAEARDLDVRYINRRTLQVTSRSNPANQHKVKVRFEPDGTVHAQCDCEWAQFQGIACAHVIAALDYLAGLKGRKLSFWTTEADAVRQKHRTFYLASSASNGDGVWITSRGLA